MSSITIAILIVLAFLCILFLLKWKIIIAMHYMIQLLFVVTVGLSLTTLFLPQLYLSLADTTLQQTGTLTTIRATDHNIQNVVNVPGNIIDGLKNLLGQGNQNNDNSTTESAGVLELNLYPTLTNTLGFLYRMMVLGGSLIGIVVLVYLSYTTAGVSEIAKLRKEYKELAERLWQLENKSKTTPA